ncbi:MAG: SSI family serine proteinase inhibitor, partial [Kineosporiaceae bacterium]
PADPADPTPGVAPSTSGSAAPVPWDTGALPAPAPASLAASGSAKLSILLDDGFGVRSTWTLTCDPAGGTHPDPATACGVLGANGAKALPAPPATTACTEQYGGPQKAKITGTWRGRAVNAELSLENGCQITRWTALLGLLPPGGVKQ